MHAAEAAVVGALLLVLLPTWLTVRDIWSGPAAAWSGAGRSRWVWTALVVLVPVLGPALYLREARPDVRDG